MAHVSVVCVLEGLRCLRRACKPTASKSSPAGIKAGDNWQEWADGRPEQVFTPSLGAPMFFWELSIGEAMRCPNALTGENVSWYLY